MSPHQYCVNVYGPSTSKCCAQRLSLLYYTQEKHVCSWREGSAHEKKKQSSDTFVSYAEKPLLTEKHNTTANHKKTLLNGEIDHTAFSFFLFCSHNLDPKNIKHHQIEKVKTYHMAGYFWRLGRHIVFNMGFIIAICIHSIKIEWPLPTLNVCLIFVHHFVPRWRPTRFKPVDVLNKGFFKCYSSIVVPAPHRLSHKKIISLKMDTKYALLRNYASTKCYLIIPLNERNS